MVRKQQGGKLCLETYEKNEEGKERNVRKSFYKIKCFLVWAVNARSHTRSKVMVVAK